MHNVISYPRGFEAYPNRRRFNSSYDYHSKPVVKMNRGDRQAVELYELHVNRSMEVTGWAFKRNVIKLAARLFGNFDAWANNNIRFNDALYGVNIDFIIDTIGFIKTGRRNLNLLTWMGLVEEKPVSDPQKKQESSYAKYNVPNVGPHWLADWLSHEDGFYDMLCSINLLFGNVNIPKGFKDSTVN